MDCRGSKSGSWGWPGAVAAERKNVMRLGILEGELEKGRDGGK